MRRGYNIAALWTDGFAEAMKSHIPMSCGQLDWYGQLDELKTLQETGEAVRKLAGDMDIIACIAGGEAGVDFADALSEHLGVPSNGTDIPNRRDKKGKAWMKPNRATEV